MNLHRKSISGSVVQLILRVAEIVMVLKQKIAPIAGKNLTFLPL